MEGEHLETMSALQERVLRDPAVMERLLLDLSINVTAMFRDPTFFRAFRELVVPLAADVPVLAALGRGLLDRRGGLLVRDRAGRGGPLRPGADLRHGHQPERGRHRAPWRVPARQDAGVHAELHPRRRHAVVLRVLRRAVRRRALLALARRQRRVRSAQPRLGRGLQRVPRDRVPQRDDLFRPSAAGARAHALLREPRDVRRARARSEGDDPVLTPRGGVRGARRARRSCIARSR